MIQVSIRIKDSEQHEVVCLCVESIFTGMCLTNGVVLHFPKDEPFNRLLDISLQHRWELYRYPSDGHVGLTIKEDEIFQVKYL